MIDNKSIALGDQKLANALQGHVLNTGGLVISATTTLAKIANTIRYMLNGNLYSKTTVDCAAISGTIATGYKNVVVFYIDDDGTMGSVMGTAATTVAGITFPAVPDNVAVIGFIIIENATGSNFVGGTTALNTGSLTVTYVDTPFPVHFSGVKNY
jgi:hypothetical protein